MIAAVWLPATSLNAQTSASALSGDAPARYYEDIKCVAVYAYVGLGFPAMIPQTIQPYFDMTQADGRTAGRTDDQIRADERTSMQTLQKNPKYMTPDYNSRNAALANDYYDCNSYYSKRGITPTLPTTPPSLDSSASTSQS